MKVEVIGNATLYFCDCLEVYEELQAADAIVSDPQYGMDLQSKSPAMAKRWLKDKNEALVVGDDKPFDPAPWLDFQKIILWGGHHYANRLPNSRMWIVWDKREGTTPDDHGDCDIAWTNLPGPTRMHRQLWRGVCRRGEENVVNGPLVHPTQKPVSLMKFCISQCKLDTGALIADPYMGSGSTGVAALRMGHRFIGVEITERYFDVACKRIEKEMQSESMFN